MVVRHEVVVVGAGAMGAATAWQLARRGRDVTVLERFQPGHHEGASHGTLRNFNMAYSQPEYVAMLVEARRLWGELEDEAGVRLLDAVGLVDHGAGEEHPAIVGALAAVGFSTEVVSSSEARERWPGIRFDSSVLHLPDSGTVRAEDSVTAMLTRAAAHGADVRHESPVDSIVVRSDGRVDLHVAGEHHIADRVVVTAGAWAHKLLGSFVELPRLTVTQEQPVHFATRDASPWPSFNHRPGVSEGYDYWLSPIYGLLSPGEGVKVGWHGAGPVIDPDARDYAPRRDVADALRRYAREWLPGVDPDEFSDISCTYTSTDDSTFIIDSAGPITIGAGFSGHGFKFTPAIGRMLADLVIGAASAPELFSLRRRDRRP